MSCKCTSTAINVGDRIQVPYSNLYTHIGMRLEFVVGVYGGTDSSNHYLILDAPVHTLYFGTRLFLMFKGLSGITKVKTDGTCACCGQKLPPVKMSFFDALKELKAGKAVKSASRGLVLDSSSRNIVPSISDMTADDWTVIE